MEEISYRPRQKSTPGPMLASKGENSRVTLKILTVALSNKALYSRVFHSLLAPKFFLQLLK
jgi:hypothetical protein